MILNWNGGDIASRLTQAWTETNSKLGERMQNAARAKVYEWPRRTVRSDGSVAGSPRDVVDTGAFVESYRLTRVGVESFDHAFTVPYAATIIIGTRDTPPRDVTAEPLTHVALDFREEFSR